MTTLPLLARQAAQQEQVHQIKAGWSKLDVNLVADAVLLAVSQVYEQQIEALKSAEKGDICETCSEYKHDCQCKAIDTEELLSCACDIRFHADSERIDEKLLRARVAAMAERMIRMLNPAWSANHPEVDLLSLSNDTGEQQNEKAFTRSDQPQLRACESDPRGDDHASSIEEENRLLRERLRADLDDAPRALSQLRAVCVKTLEENAHLADGDDCSLLELKRAVGWEPS